MIRFLPKQQKNPEEKRTIFVVFSDAYQELTLIRTGLLDDLRAKFETILIVPSQLVKKHIFAYFGYTKINIFVFQDISTSLMQKIIDALIARKYAKYAGPCRRRRWEEYRAPSNLLKRIRGMVIHVLARILPESILLFIQNHLLSDVFLDAMFKRYKPVLTILSWGAAYDPCPKVVRSAKKFGSKTISVDASWDCMDELSVIPKVDRLLVWNEAMKKEAIVRHRYDPRRVSVVGPLRCDFYRRPDFLIDRDTFFQKHRLYRDRKLITLAVNRGDSEIYSNVLRALVQADEKKRFVHPIQLILRLAPWSNPDDFYDIGKHPLVLIETSYSFDKDTLVSKEEISDTAGLLQHTDVLVSVLSTLILESVYFNTPNISLLFPEFKALYQRDFITPLFEMGGVTFVDDIPALLHAVNRYLSNPHADEKGRKAILKDLCYNGDGKVKARVLSEVNQLIKM